MAAVCYRVRKLKIEFLLVRTRKGRWTFPKGGVMRGLTRAQSAALEAFEEAGVHGRIEQAPFTRYILHKRRASQLAEIDAYLCEVLRLGSPQETDRTPKWFAAEQAQASLRERRTPEDSGELARVVARAVNRIQRLNEQNGNRGRGNTDPLQKVHFEASENRAVGLIARVALLPYVPDKQAESPKPSVIEFDADSGKILRLGPGGRLPR